MRSVRPEGRPGHSAAHPAATTSDIYTHVLGEVQHGAADSMDTVLGDLTQAKPTVKKTAATKKGKPHDHARAGPAENRAPIPTAT